MTDVFTLVPVDSKFTVPTESNIAEFDPLINNKVFGVDTIVFVGGTNVVVYLADPTNILTSAKYPVYEFVPSPNWPTTLYWAFCALSIPVIVPAYTELPFIYRFAAVPDLTNAT
jgi:hypothetical protein